MSTKSKETVTATPQIGASAPAQAARQRSDRFSRATSLLRASRWSSYRIARSPRGSQISLRTNAAGRARAMAALQRTVGSARMDHMVFRALANQCPCGGVAGENGLCAECARKQGMVQRREMHSDAPDTLPESVTHVMQSDGGERLPDDSRGEMEHAFGTDLGAVRLHHGPGAARAAEDINARAFTVGQDVYFGAGEYQPHSDGGRRLLAHELTHTVQQSSGRVALQSDQAISPPDDPLEREAESMAERIGRISRRVDTDSDRDLRLSVARQHIDAPPSLIQRQPTGDAGVCSPEQTNVSTPEPNMSMAPPAEMPVEPPRPERNMCVAPPPPPPPGGPIFVFNDQPLSRDEAFCLYTLERLQDQGLAAPERFVQQFKTARRQRAELLEGEKHIRAEHERYPGQLSGGVPYTDEMIAALEQEVTNLIEIEPVLDAALKKLRAANDAFVREFDRESISMTLDILQMSEDRANQERERYGLTERQVTETYIEEINDTDWREKTRTRTEYHMADNPESQKLAIAARVLSMRHQEIGRLQAEQHALMRSRTIRTRTDIDIVEWLPEENRAAFEALGERIRFNQRDYELLRTSLEAEYPVLASMSDPNSAAGRGRLARVGKGVSDEAAAVVGERIAEVLRNVKKSRAALSEGDLKPWKFPRIVGATKLRLNVEPGSAKDHLIDRVVQSRIEDESLWAILLAALTIGLALIAAIPTGGLSLAGAAVVVGAGVATVGLGAYVLVRDLREYELMSAAAGSDFDKARALSAEEPSLIWVALDIIGLGLDLGSAAQAFRALSPAARAINTAGRAFEQLDPALTALRGQGNAIKTGLGDALVEDALRMRQATEQAEAAIRAERAAGEAGAAGRAGEEAGAAGRTAAAVAEGVGPDVGRSIDFLHHAVCGLCFAAGTQVVTPNGRRSIETLVPGDLVLSRQDDDPSRVGYRRVNKTFCTATDQFIEVGVGGHAIRSTPGHVWWCENKGWIFAQELEVGDCVVSEEGAALRITSLHLTEEVALGYNLAVEEFATYYVAADEFSPAVWVHNTSAVRILRPEQIFQLIIPNIVITNRSQIRAVVGAALTPTGNYTTEVGGVLQYVKKGGGAGFQGFTKEATDAFEVFLTNLGKKGGGGVVVAVDLARVGSVPVYDLSNPEILKKMLDAYPRFEDMFRRVASEGVIAVGGKVPARAVQGMVHIPPGITDVERRALFTALLEACAR